MARILFCTHPGMNRYTALLYGHFAHLLWDNFRGVKAMYKNETYTGKYRIGLPATIKDEDPEAAVPLNAVAVLCLWFNDDNANGSQEIMRHCFLDSCGYRIPDQTERAFNVCVDNWLNKIQSLYEDTDLGDDTE